MSLIFQFGHLCYIFAKIDECYILRHKFIFLQYYWLLIIPIPPIKITIIQGVKLEMDVTKCLLLQIYLWNMPNPNQPSCRQLLAISIDTHNMPIFMGIKWAILIFLKDDFSAVNFHLIGDQFAFLNCHFLWNGPSNQKTS